MSPPIKYARSGDIRIAYQVMGDGPVDLLFNWTLIGNLDLWGENPYYARTFRELAEFTRLIIVNERGLGLSDRPALIEAHEERMDDFRAVMDAAGSERAHVFSASNAGPIGCLFAATYPERVRSLILWGARAKTVQAPDYPWGPTLEEFERDIERLEREGLTERDPTKPSAAMRRWAGATVGDDPSFWESQARVWRSSGPAARIAWLRTQATLDVRPILPSIHVPTLVMATADDPGFPVASVRDLADRIPNARLEVFPGYGHLWFDAWPQVLSVMREWITGAAAPAATDRFLTTMAFLDLVASTEHASRIGDDAWRHLLDRYYGVARRALAAYGGQEVDTAGDGLFAHFGGPAAAIRCCRAIAHDAAGLGLQVRAGIHSGEVERANGALRGINVVVASRIASLAAAGEVLLSSTVRDLAAGCGVTFADRGVHALKGIPEPRQVFAAV